MNNMSYQSNGKYQSLPGMQSFDEDIVENKIKSVLLEIYTEVRRFLCQSAVIRSTSDNSCHANLVQVKKWYSSNKKYCSKYTNLEWPQALEMTRETPIMNELAMYAPASLLIRNAHSKGSQVGNVCGEDISDLDQYAYDVIRKSEVATMDRFQKAAICFEAAQCETWLELKSPGVLYKKVLLVE